MYVIRATKAKNIAINGARISITLLASEMKEENISFSIQYEEDMVFFSPRNFCVYYYMLSGPSRPPFDRKSKER